MRSYRDIARESLARYLAGDELPKHLPEGEFWKAEVSL